MKSGYKISFPETFCNVKFSAKASQRACVVGITKEKGKTESARARRLARARFVLVVCYWFTFSLGSRTKLKLIYHNIVAQNDFLFMELLLRMAKENDKIYRKSTFPLSQLNIKLVVQEYEDTKNYE